MVWEQIWPSTLVVVTANKNHRNPYNAVNSSTIKKKTPHPSFQNGKEKKNGRKKSHTVTHDLDVMLRMLYGKLLDNLAWDLYVASTVCVPPSTVKSLVTLGRLYFIAKCSVLELLVKFLSKSAEAYPADFNINLILLAMSIFVVHIYACSNTISWQLLYLCLNVVLGLYFWWSTFFFFFFYFSRLFWFFFIIIIIFFEA